MRDKTFAELGVLILGAVLFAFGCIGIFGGCKTACVCDKPQTCPAPAAQDLPHRCSGAKDRVCLKPVNLMEP